MKAWVKSLLLLASTCGYIFLGGCTFMALEHQQPTATHKELTRQVAGFLANHSHCGMVEDRLRDFLENSVATAYGNGVLLSHAHPARGVQDIWTFSNAFVFAFEVVTTIGEGVMVPRTSKGRLFAMVYAAIGVPLCYLMLSAVGDTFYFTWRKLRHLFSRIRQRTIRVALGVSCTLIVLHLVLSDFPAILVSTHQGWDFFTSQYYCFMVLSTVGLGDLSRKRQMQESEEMEWVKHALSVLYDLLCLSIVSVIYKGVNEYREQVRKEEANQEEQSRADRRGDEASSSTHCSKSIDSSFELGKIEFIELGAGPDSGRGSLSLFNS
ncbi:potassium channel subfamily K member 9-like [Patiria miniata]|uniref:Potassium channel domain-containing protein n=1 Tax=Patiria miniata TaxID=46514 RepID=A0A914BEC2_PATMI|nr:potassium channel subfamily K member 9-like [Patiria miniata]